MFVILDCQILATNFGELYQQNAEYISLQLGAIGLKNLAPNVVCSTVFLCVRSSVALVFPVNF